MVKRNLVSTTKIATANTFALLRMNLQNILLSFVLIVSDHHLQKEIWAGKSFNFLEDLQSFHQNSCRKKTVIFVCPESRNKVQKEGKKSCYFCFQQNSCRKKTVIFVCPESRSRKQKQSSKSCYFCFQHNSCWKKTVIFVCPEKRNCYEVMKQRKTCYFAVSENQKLVIFCFFREPKTCYFVIDFMPQKVGCAFWPPSEDITKVTSFL